MTPSLTELATTSANDPEPDRSFDSEYDPFDTRGLTFTKRHPTTAVGGTAVALRYFPDFGDDSRQGDPSRGYAGLVVDAPFLTDVDGEQKVAVRDNAEKATGDDIKVINIDDDDTKMMPGNVGVEFDGRSFYSEAFDEWPDEDTIHDLLEDDEVSGTRTVLKLTGSSGRRATRVLDVHGKGNAQAERDENGDWKLNENGFPVMNDSLIEVHPDYYDTDEDAPTPRFAQYQTEIRPDVEGSRVVVLLQRRRDVFPDDESNAYWETVFAEMNSEERRHELAERRAEQYNENKEDDDPERSMEDYLTVVEVNGEEVEMVEIEPTADFERDPAIKNHQYTYVHDDWGHWPTTEELNEIRVEQGFDPLDTDDDDE